MPGASAERRYGPENVPGNTYTPDSFVTVLRATFVAVLVSVTVAFCTMA